ncbi:MAG: CDP-glycerol glycerophosphotransferase family protein [Kineosporiaceae bacterium]
MTSPPSRVVVSLPSDDPVRGVVALAAALSLFGPGIEVALCLAGVEAPGEQQAAQVQALCQALADDGITLPDIVLLGETEARTTRHLLAVDATDDVVETVRTVALLTAAAQEVWDRDTAPGRNLRRTVEVAVARRDLTRTAGVLPLVVAVVQVQSTWGAIADVCAELRARAGRGEIAFEVLALDSDHELRERSTAEFVAEHGYRPRDLAWFTALADDESSALALVITDSPWDDLRPEPVQSVYLAERGVRLAYLPYGNNVGAGTTMMTRAYDLPLHRLAWRAFARSEVQRGLWTQHCSSGADHVRVLGLPKLDRVLRMVAEPGDRGGEHPVRVLAGRRPVVLWNPHFTFGRAGWSTFDRYLGPLTGWAAAHPDVVLMVRPHFRLLRDLPLSGGAGQSLIDALHRAVATHENIVLDTAADYLPAFTVADAFVSDLSSLITEWVPTRRPVCYLHKVDGPGANEDAQYLFSLDVATSWEGLRAFLDAVREGRDLGAERREMVLRNHFEQLDGRASARIVEELLSSMDEELGDLMAQIQALSPLPQPADPCAAPDVDPIVDPDVDPIAEPVVEPVVEPVGQVSA